MDMDKVHEMAIRVVGDVGGAFTVTLGYIGDRLGLFKAMVGAGPTNSVALARKTNLNERYVREWMRAMVAAEYLDYDPGADTYTMSDEQAFVLAKEDSPLFVGGALQFTAPSICNVQRIVAAFQNGGGIRYDEIGEEIPYAIERLFRPGYVNFLTTAWLGAVPGLVERLQRGAAVADLGCGHGQSSVAIGKSFPRSKVLGLDSHSASIERARQLAAKEGVSNVQFLRAAADEMPAHPKFDLICSFDCIHDMVDPPATLRAIRGALADDGVYLWSEPNATAQAHANRNPVGKMFHAISPMHCMTVSLAHGGAGLGTVIGEEGARGLAAEAGFSHFEKLPIQHPLNQFFALRK